VHRRFPHRQTGRTHVPPRERDEEDLLARQAEGVERPWSRSAPSAAFHERSYVEATP